MARKIYYTVNTGWAGFPVSFIDEQGKEVLDDSLKAKDPGQAKKEFEIAHAGATYLTPYQFAMRLSKIEDERYKLAAWKEWAV